MWSRLEKISTNEEGVPLHIPSRWKKRKHKKKPVEVFNFDADQPGVDDWKADDYLAGFLAL
jgi:hypothetical protein